MTSEIQSSKSRRDTNPHSRGAIRPRFVPASLAKQRAWGMPGAQCTRSLACKVKKHTSIVTTGPPRSPGIPARNGFNGFLRALPGDRAFLSPSLYGYPQSLTPASRRQDHTTSPSASAPFVLERIHVHRIPPRVRDDRETPLRGAERANCKSDLPDARSEIFL